MALLIQGIVDLLFVVAVVALWIQFRRPRSEDPRLTAGLQDLQSKIAVLEDLGDRTEKQVQQLMTILENKLIDVQKKIDQADNVQGKISKSMEKSLEVARIFQDRIPHEEIGERQSTLKFVKAALLAHQGLSVREISEQVDLPYGELEFIIKVNKDELSFDANRLPEWIQSEIKETEYAIKDDLQFLDSPLHLPQQLKTGAGLTSADQEALQTMGEKFRQAQIIVSQRKIMEPQQKVFDVQTEDLRADEANKVNNEVNNVGNENNKDNKVNEVKEHQNRVATTVQRLVEQKRRELEANLVTNLGLANLARPPQHKEQMAWAMTDRAMTDRAMTDRAMTDRANERQPVRKPAKPSMNSTISASPGVRTTSVIRSESANKIENVQFPLESKILKKGKELGIRPVVFPRIEVSKK
jgi:hypothetical protein